MLTKKFCAYLVCLQRKVWIGSGMELESQMSSSSSSSSLSVSSSEHFRLFIIFWLCQDVTSEDDPLNVTQLLWGTQASTGDQSILSPGGHRWGVR